MIFKKANMKHEYVDLGLPSGLKWATCNIGANSPEECGDYFAWGETKPKENYCEENSLTHPKNIATSKNRLWNISGKPKYDAATANWGDEWRMPTKDEMLELITVCELEEDVMLNGKQGLKIIGHNGNSIFLPYTCICFERQRLEKSYCSYWTSSVCEGVFLSYRLDINDRIIPSSRSVGYAIRAVRSEKLGVRN